MSSPDELAELRLALHRNGYHPIPVVGAHISKQGAGKCPALRNWPTVCRDADEDEIVRWSKSYPLATNTGILCDPVVGIDIDILNEAIAGEIEALAKAQFGQTPLKRIGKAPKLLLVYGAPVPFRKIQTDEFFMPDGTIGRVEVLAVGQQFVGYGTHPDTLSDYLWPEHSPVSIAAHELPTVAEQAVLSFRDAAETLLRQTGGLSHNELREREREGRRSAKLGAGERPPRALVEVALDHISNDLPYEDWVRVGFAIYSEYGPDGLDLWERWSCKSAKNDSSFTSQKYGSFSAVHSITVGTIFYYAKQNGWRPGQTEKNGDPTTKDGDYLPTIYVSGGRLPREIDKAEDALIASGVDVYQRGGLIVRPALRPIEIADGREIAVQALVPVKVPHLRKLMTRAAVWARFDMRSGEWVRINCPKDHAEEYLTRGGWWKLRVLTGLIDRPTLRQDGSILSEPGYDPATGLFLDPKGMKWDPIPASPSWVEAKSALAELSKLIEEVPFASSADRAVALSAFLTPLIRHALPTAPLHAFTAPTAGTGKSFLVDLAGMIATGHEVAVMSQNGSAEEDKKCLGASLVAGHELISIDNCDQPLKSPFLCQMLTQQSVAVRILGETREVQIPPRVTIFATGNNLVISGDLIRRCLLCSLDSKWERPELREFQSNPKELISKNRGRYVSLGLTILRAYHVAGRPSLPQPWGSFEGWSWVRGALMWLGCADPCETIEKIRDEDPKLEAKRVLLRQWRDLVGLRRITARELAAIAMETAPVLSSDQLKHPALHDSLQYLAGENGAIVTRRLGKCLGDLAGQIIEGMKVVKDVPFCGNQLWKLEVIEAEMRRSA